MTKRWVLALVVATGGAFAAAPSAKAAAPELMSYQGVLVQDSGIAVPDGVYDLVFRLFDQQGGGNHLFEQTLSVQVVHGLYNVILSSTGGYDLAAVVTGNSQLFIEVTVLANPPAVPADVTLLPRQQLASVPYALSSRLVSAQMLRNSTPKSLTTGEAGQWTTPAGLEDLTFDVPSSGCIVEVEARVVVEYGGSCCVHVGARIDERIDGGSYTKVAGDTIESLDEVGGTQPGIATVAVSYVLESPVVGEYAYRVQTRDDTASPYATSPMRDALQGESTLSGKLWCP